MSHPRFHPFRDDSITTFGRYDVVLSDCDPSRFTGNQRLLLCNDGYLAYHEALQKSRGITSPVPCLSRLGDIVITKQGRLLRPTFQLVTNRDDTIVETIASFRDVSGEWPWVRNYLRDKVRRGIQPHETLQRQRETVPRLVHVAEDLMVGSQLLLASSASTSMCPAAFALCLATSNHIGPTALFQLLRRSACLSDLQANLSVATKNK